MYIDRARLKADARGAMAHSKTSVYLFALVYILVSYLLTALSGAVNNVSEVEAAILNGDLETALEYAADVSFFGTLISILLELVGFMLQLGAIVFMLRVWRRQENSLGNLLDGLPYLLKAVWLEILIGVFTALWTLLFIVPGIIASYKYSQAFYILLDDPSKSAMQCIRESKEMMKGRKWEYFVFRLSFIGWDLLSVIPFVSVYTMPYIETSCCGWYDTVAHPDRQEPKDAGYPWEYEDERR